MFCVLSNCNQIRKNWIVVGPCEGKTNGQSRCLAHYRCAWVQDILQSLSYALISGSEGCQPQTKACTMHNYLILVMGWVSCNINDVLNYLLIWSSRKKEPKTVKSTTILIVTRSVSIPSRQKVFHHCSILAIFKDKSKRGDWGELIPMCALACPSQILLFLNEWVILGISLEEW